MQNESLITSKTEKLLSIGQASEYLGISIDTLRRWEKKGKITAYRSPGSHRYFKKSDLDKLFGTKYERTEETLPRKIEKPQVVEKTPSVAIEEVQITSTFAPQKTEVSDLELFNRPVREVKIPSLEPIRVIKEEIKSFTAFDSQNKAASFFSQTQTQNTFSPTLQEQGNQDIQKEVVGKNKYYHLSTNQLILIVILIVIMILFIIVIYTITKPQPQKLISPIA